MDQLKCFMKRNLDFFVLYKLQMNDPRTVILLIPLCYAEQWPKPHLLLFLLDGLERVHWIGMKHYIIYLLHYYSCFLHNNSNLVLHFHSRISCVEEVRVRNLCNPTSVCLAKEVPSNKTVQYFSHSRTAFRTRWPTATRGSPSGERAAAAAPLWALEPYGTVGLESR